MLFFAGFELDLERARLRGPDGEAIRLRPKSFDMLQLFATNAGRVLSKQDLIDAIWPNIHVGDDSLFQCIREIRTALGDEQRQMIRLVSGRGYLFEAEVSVRPAGPGGLAGGPGGGAETNAAAAQAIVRADVVAAPHAMAVPVPGRPRFGLRGAAAFAVVAGLGAVLGLALSIFAPDLIFARKPPAVATAQSVSAADEQKIAEIAVKVAERLSAVLGPVAAAPTFAPDINLAGRPLTIAVMPIAGAGSDPQIAEMAAGVTDRLTEGLAKIDRIRVLSPRSDTLLISSQSANARTDADFVVRAELRMEGGAWTIQARMSNGASGEVRWADSVSVGTENASVSLQQTRLTAGVGHPLALRINAMFNAGPGATDRDLAGGKAKVVIEQAMASINQTTPERFKAAQTMLEKAIADEPGNVDLEAALAAHLLRGIQMVWYNGDIAETQRTAQSMLERALRAKPTYIPVLEAYCRFLNATNQFIESLVACGRVLTFDPWDGLAIYNLGLGQLRLGRFEDALATFKQAEQFDTPRTARWTWLLGAGLTLVVMDRDEEAIPYLTRSIAITPATGRSHAVLATAYQRLGRTEEAKAALAKTMELRPGSTAANIALDPKNASPLYTEAGKRVAEVLVGLGLPEK